MKKDFVATDHNVLKGIFSMECISRAESSEFIAGCVSMPVAQDRGQTVTIPVPGGGFNGTR
jgi:hypothetical protein